MPRFGLLKANDDSGESRTCMRLALCLSALALTPEEAEREGSNQWLSRGHEFRIQTPVVPIVTLITHQIVKTISGIL